MFAFKSIRLRLFMMLVLPVVLLLAVTSILEYIYIRTIILEEWQASTILRLERAARQIDLRLKGIISGMEAFANTGGSPLGDRKQEWLLQRLQGQEGISRAALVWKDTEPAPHLRAGEEKKTPGAPLSRRIRKVSPPQYLLAPEEDTITLRGELWGAKKRLLGHLEVSVTLTYLMHGLHDTSWPAGNLLCLVDSEGRYVAHPDPAMQGRPCLGESDAARRLALLQAMEEKPAGTLWRQGYIADQVVGFYRLTEAPFAILLKASGKDILAPFFRFRWYFFLSTIVSLVALLLLLRWGLSPTIAAVQQLAAAAAGVAQGRYVTLPVPSRDEIGRLTQSFNDMVAGLQERELISTTFGRYVDPQVAKELLRCPVAAALGGQKRQVAILMTDIRGFTPLAESLSPDVLIRLLNLHFSTLIDIVHRHGGIIVDFFGDSILAFFDPQDSPVAPVVQQALKCALEIPKAMPEFQASHPEWPPMAVGVGLHCGKVVVGNIGSESRTKYGIVGAAVNFTHRLQAQAQAGEVVVSEEIYSLTHDTVEVTRKIVTPLKGVKGLVTLYVVQERRRPPAPHTSGGAS